LWTAAEMLILPAPGGVDAGLQLWVKADAGTSSTTNGTAVSTWSDQSGNGNNMTVTAANRDPFYTDPAITSNFNPTVDFDGSNDGMEIAPFMMGVEPGGSVFGAAANNTPGTGFDNLVVFGVDNPHLGTAAGTGKPLGYCNGSSPIRNDHPTDPVPGQFHLWSWQWDMANEPSNTLSNNGLDVIFDGQVNSAPTMEVRESQFANGAPAADQFQIGSYEAVEVWDGPIGEIAVYNRNLTALESQKVNSYFSIKWGTTLDNNPASGTVNYDYVNSAGTTIWGGTSDAGYQAYHHGVAGIGRDDNSGLNQKQSKSVTVGASVAIYHGNQSAGLPAANVDNTTAFGADQDFLVWGHNGNAATFAVSYAPNTFTPVAGYYHLGRIWKVQETGTVGTVTVHGPNNADHLLVHSSADFSTGTPTEIAMVDDGSGNRVATVNLADGQYFTFGREIFAPGCVAANLTAWYKADVGVTGVGAVTAWADQSGNGIDVIQVTATHQPALSGLVNFNPSLRFDGANDHLEYKGPRFLATYSSGTMFGAATNGIDGGLENLAVLGIDNPHMGINATPGKGANQQEAFMWMNTSSPVFFYNPTKLVANRAEVYGYFWNGGGPNVGSGLRINGTETLDPLSEATGVASSGSVDGMWTIGAYEALEPWNGYIPEIILYDRNLTNTEKQKIETYLAIKYGTTLSQNYLAGDGATIYNVATYGAGVAGIGRDDCQALVQKQSKSVNTGSVVAIYNGDQSGGLPTDNATNTSTFGADKSFMIWGHNGSAANFATPYAPNTFLPAGGYFHLDRIWKVQETGSVGVVTVHGPSGADHLLVHSSADFSAGTPTEIALADDGNGNLVATVDLTDGQFFTFGQESKSPGCVNSELVLWLKADAGVTEDAGTVSLWNDFSGEGNNVSQATVGNRPTKEDAQLNFNPALKFDLKLLVDADGVLGNAAHDGASVLS
jgi:hypothetical protein